MDEKGGGDTSNCQWKVVGGGGGGVEEGEERKETRKQ